MITKGIRISQLVERKDLNGKEIIPFQDGIHNGKLSIQSLIDYIGDISDSDLELQALIKIQKFVDTVSEMDLLLYQAKEGDIYYCKENKKLYVRSFNKWDMLDPLTSKVYVLVGLDEYNRTNIIHLWDGNDMVVMSERLFIGEVTGTAYDGGKGKHNKDIIDSLPDTVLSNVSSTVEKTGTTNKINVNNKKRGSDELYVDNTDSSVVLDSSTSTEAGLMAAADKKLFDSMPKMWLTENTTVTTAADKVTVVQPISRVIDGVYADSGNLYRDIPAATTTTAGVMTAADKVRLDTGVAEDIQAEREAREAADRQLQSNIDAEASTRSQADTALGNRITTESSDREAADTELQQAISAETTRATGKEAELSTAISTETSERQKGDQDNNTRITEVSNQLNGFIATKGQPNGFASLDSKGLIPSSQLPAYVDDVIEVATFDELPEVGEAGKIYVTLDTNLTYRWSGTRYIEISQSLALGETSSTAYAGDKGKYLKDVSDSLPSDIITSINYLPSTNYVNIMGNKKTKGEDGIYIDADQAIVTIGAASSTFAGVMTIADKVKLDGLKTQEGITSDIDSVQSNLTTHITNKQNPHSVTKAQVGLGNVDNTSDADKPVSTATQNALNDKFSATEGNTLKQIVNDMPDLVVTGGSLRHNSDSVSLNLIQQNLKNPDDAGSFLLKFNSVTDSTAGIILPSDKVKVDKIITNGDGTKYLADNGQYKTVQGGSADIEAIKKYVDDSVTSARSIGYMMQLTEIDASGLDENTWYPVTIAAGARMCMRAEVLVALDSGTKPSWSTHEGGFSTRKIWEWAPSTWGVNAVSDIKVYLSDFAHTNLDPVRGLNFLSHSDTCFVFVRGGGKYHFYTSHGAQVILHTSTYKPSEASDQSVSPTTTTPKPINALDLKNYGKVIDVPNGSYLTLNVNRVGADAIDYINNVFGSKDRLKEVIMDIIENHQRYLFHSYVSNLNCVEPNNVYVYYDDATNEYNLQYNLSYYTTNGPVSKRTAFKLMPNNEDCVAISEDLLPDWHGNEFNFADGEVGERVWLNYRSRSGNTVSAGKLYIGDGQATGGFAEVYASGFFKESDVRLKSNIAPLNHTLDQICNIPTVEFDMHDKHQIGTVAQDLENNFAEIVNTDSDGMKSVDYCMLGVVAVEGIKLLKQEIEDLKKQVEELKNGNAILGRNL